MAYKLHCLAKNIPFMYLGLSVGENLKRRINWKAIEEKISKKMNGWKAHTLSMGGRVTLIRSVLNNLPLYYFSLFQAPSSFLVRLEKVQNKFVWGDGGLQRKMIWASNHKTGGDYTVGGLRIGSLDGKNLALLSKWWWRFQKEPSSFWARVVSNVYGQDGDLNRGDWKEKGRPWSYILNVGKTLEEKGVPFTSTVHQKLGNGESIKDRQLGWGLQTLRQVPQTLFSGNFQAWVSSF